MYIKKYVAYGPHTHLTTVYSYNKKGVKSSMFNNYGVHYYECSVLFCGWVYKELDNG